MDSLRSFRLSTAGKRFVFVVSTVFTLVVVTGCGTGSELREPQTAGSSSKGCVTVETAADLTTAGQNTYRTGDTIVALREGRLVAEDGAGAVTVLVEDGVDHIFGIWDTVGGAVIVYRGVAVGDEAELLSVPVNGSTAAAKIGYAAAPEFFVTAVSYDRLTDHWVTTAISDLTETIDRISRGNPDDHVVFEPYPYNDSETMLMAAPVKGGGFIAVISPYSAVDSGIEPRWYAAQLDSSGAEVARVELVDVNTSVETSRLLIPLEQGQIMIRSKVGVTVISGGKDLKPSVRSVC